MPSLPKLPTYADLDRSLRSTFALKWVMNAWPPMLFAGIRITHLSPDARTARVRLSKNPLTSNYVGTQFGGSLYAMTDPFWMLLVGRALGPDYTVWDKRGEIDYLRPGRTAVEAEFRVTDDLLDEIRAGAADGGAHLHWLTTDVVATDGTVVARVRKQLHVRLRPSSTLSEAEEAAAVRR
ncbi:DUF4442 domain-containing protein [Georgenia sp. Z1491]|uniref:DUF4442 domain-containing protein n=1 Tax=Georgenia sp. Z1491 TaxID=3416707 RepID=UPI003CF6D03E